MIDIDEYYETFKNRIKWCNKNLLQINSKINDTDDKYLIKIRLMLLEYKRDCSIACRKIDLIRKKYNEVKNISEESKKDLEETLSPIRFKKYSIIKGYVKGSL